MQGIRAILTPAPRIDYPACQLNGSAVTWRWEPRSTALLMVVKFSAAGIAAVDGSIMIGVMPLMLRLLIVLLEARHARCHRRDEHK